MMKLRNILLHTSKIFPFLSGRRYLLKLAGINLDDNCVIKLGAQVWKGVKLGKMVTIEKDTLIRFAEVNDYSVIDRNALVLGIEGNKLKIGKHSYVGYNSILDGSDNLTIGDHVHIAAFAGIWTHSSLTQALYGENLTENKYRKESSVIIENNVWIGSNVTIYPGILVAHHSAVLPNSVVNCDVPPYTIVGGIPATFKRKIVFSDNNIEFIKD